MPHSLATGRYQDTRGITCTSTRPRAPRYPASASRTSHDQRDRLRGTPCRGLKDADGRCCALVDERLLAEARRNPMASSPANLPTTIPAELTSFVGRRQDIGAIRQLASTTRLVTLTGM